MRNSCLSLKACCEKLFSVRRAPIVDLSCPWDRLGEPDLVLGWLLLWQRLLVICMECRQVWFGNPSPLHRLLVKKQDIVLRLGRCAWVGLGGPEVTLWLGIIWEDTWPPGEPRELCPHQLPGHFNLGYMLDEPAINKLYITVHHCRIKRIQTQFPHSFDIGCLRE